MPMSMPSNRRFRSRASASGSPALRGRNYGSPASTPRSSGKAKPETVQTTGNMTPTQGATRTVTPSSSWEDFGQGYGTTNKTGPSTDRSTTSSYYTNTSFEDEDMPMDELMASTTPVTPTRSVSSEPVSTNTGRMILALKSHSGVCPDGLSPDEQRLWNTFQEAMSRVAGSGHNGPAAPVSSSRIYQLEAQLKEAKDEIETKATEHETEVRAIQRVLAEMTTEREEETEILNQTVETLSQKVDILEKEKSKAWKDATPPAPSATDTPAAEDSVKLKVALKDLDALKVTHKKDLDRKARRIMVLERELKVVKTQLKRAEEGSKAPQDVIALGKEVEELKIQLGEFKEKNKKLQTDLENAKEKKTKKKAFGSMTPPRPDSATSTDAESVSSAISAEEVESLQKNLSETSSSLENAKKIIASLENANGSMAVDLRAKLKAKEEELSMVHHESSERKRRLDSLATELRDLQKKQDDVDKLERQSKSQIVRHKALMMLLEKSVSGLQSASAVHEVSTSTGQPDQGNVDHISEILSDTMIAIRSSLSSSEQYMDEFDDTSTVANTDVDLASDIGRQIDTIIKNDREVLATGLREELEQKNVIVAKLEEALKKQTEELARLKSVRTITGDNEELIAEIQSLREQCSTNLEVLAKKERELSVLRSSLKVDENDAGYISDDASDADEDENDSAMSPARLNGYGVAETEALATLMAAGGGMLGREPSDGKYFKALAEKEKALKDLESERESLANAKLIISSLEKANKSMMEDLRSRLHDSNTAIASLLDKSMEHEKSSNVLKEEVERLRTEKESLLNKHEEEMQRLKEETKAYSLRAASEDAETDIPAENSEEKKDDEEEAEV